nr:hypothetical protein [Tanacetum cinerariifolium]
MIKKLQPKSKERRRLECKQPKVQESLKYPVDEHVILDDLISLTGTLYSMKNLEDAYVVRDQFINGKSTKDEPEKPNVEAKMVSMVTVPVYQASSSVPSLSTLNKKNKALNNMSCNIRFRVFNLEHRDLPLKIDEVIHESVREALHVALQALLRDHFRELPEADMKEILHQRMFETGTYKSLPKHVALYKALEASIERANRDELLTRNGQPQAPQSSAWKKSDTQDDTLSSSKQQSGPHTEQPVKDLPMPETTNISDSEDIDSAP